MADARGDGPPAHLQVMAGALFALGLHPKNVPPSSETVFGRQSCHSVLPQYLFLALPPFEAGR